MTPETDSKEHGIVAAYRKLSDSRLKHLIKNAASFVIHRLSYRVEEVVIDGKSIKLYRNRMISSKQLMDDITGYHTHSPLQLGQVVIDVGAYTGLYTIYSALKVGPEGKVVAFEPDPYNRMMLKRNVQLNGLRNVIFSSKGLYSREGVLAFDVQGFGSHIIKDGQPCNSMNRVHVTTLDTELERMNIAKVDFIKMDVEGAELETLKGCVGIIAASPTLEFGVASYHIVDGEQTSGRVETFFRSQGLDTFSGYPKHPTTFGYRPMGRF